MDLGLEYITSTPVVDITESMLDYIFTQELYFDNFKYITEEIKTNLTRLQNIVSVNNTIKKYKATESICALVGNVSVETLSETTNKLIEWIRKRIAELRQLFNKIVDFFSKKDKEQEVAANQAVEESKKEDKVNPTATKETIKLHCYISNLDRGYNILFDKVTIPFRGVTDDDIIAISKEELPTATALISENLIPKEGELTKSEIYAYVQLLNKISKFATDDIKKYDSDIREYERECSNFGVDEKHIAALNARIANTEYKVDVLRQVKNLINQSRTEATEKIKINKPRNNE